MNTARHSKETLGDEIHDKKKTNKKMITLTMGPHFKEN